MAQDKDRRDTIGQVISVLSQFTDKIKWVFNRDLKPRTLFGLKSDGTVVYIGDTNGFPQFANKVNKGELLLSGSVAIAGTTVVYSEWFETKGYKNLFLTVANPLAWATNPTALGLAIQFTHDNGTTKYILKESAGAASLSFALNKDDAIAYCLFLLQIDYTEAVGSAPFPNIDSNMKIRLMFTPTGSAESQPVGFKLYGVP